MSRTIPRFAPAVAAKTALAACTALAVSAALGACSSSPGSNPNLPRSAANVAVCNVFQAFLAGTASVQSLAGSVLESNAPISHQLRQDVAQFATTAATAGTAAAQQAEATVKQDCAAVDGG